MIPLRYNDKVSHLDTTKAAQRDETQCKAAPRLGDDDVTIQVSEHNTN